MSEINNSEYGGFIISRKMLLGNPIGFAFHEQSARAELNGWTLYSIDDDDEYASQPENYIIATGETVFSVAPVIMELFNTPYGTDLTCLYEEGVHIGFWDNNTERETTIAEILQG